MAAFEKAALYSAAMGSREMAMVVIQNITPPPIVSLDRLMNLVIVVFFGFTFTVFPCFERHEIQILIYKKTIWFWKTAAKLFIIQVGNTPKLRLTITL